MAEPLILTTPQRKVVDHFAGFILDEAARARYVALVEAALRNMPSFSDLHVTAAAIRATTIAKRL